MVIRPRRRPSQASKEIFLEFHVMTLTTLPEDDCPICREPYNHLDHQPVEVYNLSPCEGHIFGSSCFHTWLDTSVSGGKTTCPLCRTVFYETQTRLDKAPAGFQWVLSSDRMFARILRIGVDILSDEIWEDSVRAPRGYHWHIPGETEEDGVGYGEESWEVGEDDGDEGWLGDLGYGTEDEYEEGQWREWEARQRARNQRVGC
ncbi:hypothetical protein P154DRAFT_534664 [Amniculicola lignicola CBS 123094]|uniref:RING-type domain-containing protein n=1 Tax=Amniculicola lignicola CBS 123094 TaxID=1392246 RepID=A0A6A5WGR3_9PLEO|nr:hypothetical protein P154DRAFT_534664 [Amniculicola lignicola CBS 123094]